MITLYEPVLKLKYYHFIIIFSLVFCFSNAIKYLQILTLLSSLWGEKLTTKHNNKKRKSQLEGYIKDSERERKV